MKTFAFLCSIVLVSLIGSSLSTPIEADSSLDGINIEAENVANFWKWIEEIRAPSVDDSSEDLRADVLVTIKNGTLQGKTDTTLPIGGKRFYSFSKVPYAKAPVGELRFEAPQPHEGWTGIYNARPNPPACAQYLTAISLPPTEDCLFLSIHTPRAANETGELLPVMFFIHGGAFVFGEASAYGPNKLLNTQNDVIFISMQYRLGPLGFLSTGDDVLPGNAGMKDQIQALRWVQENIEAFGGDPNKVYIVRSGGGPPELAGRGAWGVTLFGESAGSASSTYMLISPLARGLFSKVIAMSGSAIGEWGIDRNPMKNAQRLAGQVGCPNTTSAELVSCMKEVPWLELARNGAVNTVFGLAKMGVELPGSSPVIERDVPGAFLTDDPVKLFLEAPLPDIPIVMGAVQNEGTLPVAGFYFLTLERFGHINDPVYMREKLLGEFLRIYGVNDDVGGGALSQSVALAFLPDKNRTDFMDMVYELGDLLGVLFMKAPVLRLADILARRSPNNVYLYSFEYYGVSSLYTIMAAALPIVIPGKFPPRMRPGIMHADDMHYMFPIPMIHSPADNTFQRLFCEIWTNFATTGNPTPSAQPNYPIWPAYDANNQYYYKLARLPEVKSGWANSWRQGIP